MKTSVVNTQPRKDNKSAVVHNTNVADDNTSSDNRDALTMDTSNAAHATAPRNSSPASRRRYNNRTVVNTAPPTNTGSWDYCKRSGHYLDECSTFSGLNIEAKHDFAISERRFLIACAPDTYRAIVGHVTVAARVEVRISHYYIKKIGR